jgi:hypothetical protein
MFKATAADFTGSITSTYLQKTPTNLHGLIMQRILYLVILLVAAQNLPAQQPPYDVFPSAEPPYFRVRYEASATLVNSPFR